MEKKRSRRRRDRGGRSRNDDVEGKRADEEERRAEREKNASERKEIRKWAHKKAGAAQVCAAERAARRVWVSECVRAGSGTRRPPTLRRPDGCVALPSLSLSSPIMERYNKQFNTLRRDGWQKPYVTFFSSPFFPFFRRSPLASAARPLFSLPRRRSEARKKNGGKKNTFYILCSAQVEISTAIARPLRSLRRRRAASMYATLYPALAVFYYMAAISIRYAFTFTHPFYGRFSIRLISSRFMLFLLHFFRSPCALGAAGRSPSRPPRLPLPWSASKPSIYGKYNLYIRKQLQSGECDGAKWHMFGWIMFSFLRRFCIDSN